MTMIARMLFAVLGCAAAKGAFAFWVQQPSYAGPTELYNEQTGHYVLITRREELEAVLGGRAGEGWRRTGYTLSYRTDPWAPPGRVPVCRFYAPGPNSHFYTADGAECHELQRPGSGWIYEGEDFWAYPVVNGQCASGAPVYRLYNDGAARRDTNHRYTQDERVRARLVALGWIDEGVRFCMEPMRERAVATQALATSANLSALNLPPFAAAMHRHIGDVPGPPDPGYPTQADVASGWKEWWARLLTVSASLDPAEVQSRSFAQVAPPGFYPGTETIVGLHVAGRDRTATVAALGLRKRIDPSWRPWSEEGEADVIAGTWLRAIGDIRRNAGHAYAFYALDLRDTASGLPLRVTLQMLGTQDPGDFVGRADDGTVIVSTPFSERTAFGLASQGRYITCADGCAAPNWVFRFRLGVEDIREVVSRARRAEPRLAREPAAYAVEGFECRAEAYLDAEIGLTLQNCMLEVTF